VDTARRIPRKGNRRQEDSGARWAGCRGTAGDRQGAWTLLAVRYSTSSTAMLDRTVVQQELLPTTV
jgi:hypothetical protein